MAPEDFWDVLDEDWLHLIGQAEEGCGDRGREGPEAPNRRVQEVACRDV